MPDLLRTVCVSCDSGYLKQEMVVKACVSTCNNCVMAECLPKVNICILDIAEVGSDLPFPPFNTADFLLQIITLGLNRDGGIDSQVFMAYTQLVFTEILTVNKVISFF